jgi:hypothetical protein
MTSFLREAQTLAEFSNAATADAEYFRYNYENFVPAGWWVTRRISEEDFHVFGKDPPFLWQIYQRQLREAWQGRFPIENCVQLISASRGLDPSGLNEPVASNEHAVLPYQRAVMFLGIESWRARFCFCGRRFVADKPGRKFCSDRCFIESRKHSRRAWWREHGEDWRADRAKPRGKRKGRRNSAKRRPR